MIGSPQLVLYPAGFDIFRLPPAPGLPSGEPFGVPAFAGMTIGHLSMSYGTGTSLFVRIIANTGRQYVVLYETKQCPNIFGMLERDN